MVTVIYGDEPWLGDHYREKETSGEEYVRATSFAAKESLYLKTKLLIGQPRLCLVLGCSKDINDRLLEYVSEPNENAHLIIQLKEYDLRLKAMKRLISAKGIKLIECKRYTSAQCRAFIRGRLEKAGKTVAEDVVSLIAERIGYGMDDDITLYNVENQVENLIYASDDVIGAETVMDVILERCCIDRFGITPLIGRGEWEKVIGIIPDVQRQIGSIALLSILLRELRIAYKAKFFTKDEIGSSSRNMKDWDIERIEKAMECVNEVIRMVTQAKMPEEAAVYAAICDIKMI